MGALTAHPTAICRRRRAAPAPSRAIWRARCRSTPLRRCDIRATLTLQDTGYFEGLAAETADITLFAELTDVDGNILRTITMRESASAPLQRSASRQQRLQAAMTRLANRLAAQL